MIVVYIQLDQLMKKEAMDFTLMMQIRLDSNLLSWLQSRNYKTWRKKPFEKPPNRGGVFLNNVLVQYLDLNLFYIFFKTFFISIALSTTTNSFLTSLAFSNPRKYQRRYFLI